MSDDAPRLQHDGPTRWRLLQVALHLSRREAESAHRWTLFGWLWPLGRQLLQLAVLVFVFTEIVDLQIPDYPLFVFTGLLAWSWFSGGVGAASWSMITRRHLVFQPGFPVGILPVVAVVVPFIDVLVGLPVLALLLIDRGDISPLAVLVPAVAAMQILLMCGIGWLLASVTVFLRDIPNLVGVVLMALFYMTPVFFPLDRVPERYRGILELNPVVGLIESYRALLLRGELPAASHVVVPVVASALALLAGRIAMRRLRPGFIDLL